MNSPRPSPRRIRRRRSTLTVMLADIAWERDQLTTCLAVLSRDTQKNQRERLAALAAFIIHARNLRDFLYGAPAYNKQPGKPTSGHRDDVLANDFFLDYLRWDQVRPKETLLLRRLNDKANKHLGHLTYSRMRWKRPSTPASQRGWLVGGYYQDIMRALACFRMEADRVIDWSSFDV